MEHYAPGNWDGYIIDYLGRSFFDFVVQTFCSPLLFIHHEVS